MRAEFDKIRICSHIVEATAAVVWFPKFTQQYVPSFSEKKNTKTYTKPALVRVVTEGPVFPLLLARPFVLRHPRRQEFSAAARRKTTGNARVAESLPTNRLNVTYGKRVMYLRPDHGKDTFSDHRRRRFARAENASEWRGRRVSEFSSSRNARPYAPSYRCSSDRPKINGSAFPRELFRRPHRCNVSSREIKNFFQTVLFF